MISEARRILVVEDEEALAEGLRFNLERKHYAVEVARDGDGSAGRARGRQIGRASCRERV